MQNLSEGFTRGTSGEIVQFFRYALASLAEVKDHLIECKDAGSITPEHFDRVYDIAEHTRATSINFKKPHEAKARTEGPKRRRSRT